MRQILAYLSKNLAIHRLYIDCDFLLKIIWKGLKLSQDFLLIFGTLFIALVIRSLALSWITDHLLIPNGET